MKKQTQLDPFNQKLKALPIEKKAFLRWAIEKGYLSIKLDTAIKKSHNSVSKGRSGNTEVKCFNEVEQQQVRTALQSYAQFIGKEIERF